MRKVIYFLVIMLCSFSTAYAETNQDTVEFLKEVNEKYYCLECLGLKAFSCELKVSLSPGLRAYTDSQKDPEGTLRALSGQIFRLYFSSDGKINIFPLEPLPADLANNEAAKSGREGFEKYIVDCLNIWVGLVLQPQFGLSDFKADCHVVNGPQGFSVFEKTLGGISAENVFDKDMKRLELKEQSGKEKFLMKSDFKTTRNGFLLMGAVLGDTNFRVTYRSLNDYWLPDFMTSYVRIRTVLNGGKITNPGVYEKDKFLVFSFGNYHFNP